MKLSEFKNHLEHLEILELFLENGQKVPSHFHITEVGLTTKHFTDCGNTFRIKKNATIQLWTSVDYWHRLDPKKVALIIASSGNVFEGEDLDLEVEYQQETIGKFELEFINNQFILKSTKTDCLAKESCELPLSKVKIKMSELQEQIAACFNPNSKCC